MRSGGTLRAARIQEDQAVAEPQTVTQTVPLSHAFELARLRHLSGELAEARKIYERILDAAPDHAEAMVMLGSISYREGDDESAQALHDQAINLTRAAQQRNPERIASRASLVNLLLARGRVAEAESLIGGLDIPLNPMRASDEEFAARQESGVARGLPSILITTMPKSASESIWNKLTQGLGFGQCYLSLGLFPDCCLIPSRVAAASKGGVVTKEHIGPTSHNLSALAHAGIDRLVVHHRDPRQATLSWAHFAQDDINKRLMAPLWRQIVPPAAVLDQSLSAQIDWCLEAFMPRLIDFLSRWREVAQDPEQSLSVLFMSFETFRTDPTGYFNQVLDFYGIPLDEFAPEAEAETVHLRKGQIDEWRGVFSEAQRRRAWELIPGDMAEAFGWEP